MKKWVIGIISGLLVTVVGGIILHNLVDKDDKTVQPKVEPVKKSDQIHFQELQNKRFQSEIFSDKNGKKRPTTVWGYLDLDEGKHNKNNCDLMIGTIFFDQESGYTIRSFNSDIEISHNGKCPDMIQKPDGSSQITLSYNREYCVKTNQGRMASVVFHRILTSWGKYATIDVRMTIRSFDTD